MNADDGHGEAGLSLLGHPYRSGTGNFKMNGQREFGADSSLNIFSGLPTVPGFLA